jgi:PAS domain S-box-containing protein
MNEFAARARNDESTVPGRGIDPRPVSEDASFRSLAETSLQGIIVHRDWRILFANLAAAQTLGYPTVEDLVSVESFRQLIPVDEQSRLETYRDARLRGEPVPERYQARLLHKDGTTIWVDLLPSILEWRGERAIQSTFVDISDSVRTQQMLRESEERFRNLVEGSPQGISIVDINHAPLFVNDAYAAMFGYRSIADMQLLDSHLDLFAPKSRDCVRACGEARLRGDSAPATCEADGIRMDGSVVHMVITMRLIAWNGHPAFQISATDISERKRTEVRLHDYQQQLRRLASEISLAEEKERRRIASELHDGAIQNLALAKIKLGEFEKGLPPKLRGNTLDEIRELLDLSIHDARSLIFELSPPVLYELGLGAAIEWLGEQFQARHGISCRVAVSQGEAPVNIEIEVILFQVLRELLVNVTKHANASRVSVELRRLDDRLSLQVHDDGDGFDAASVLTGSGSGGFGLFNIRERLQLLGATFEIESGKGTSVTVTAPLAAEPVEQRP